MGDIIELGLEDNETRLGVPPDDVLSSAIGILNEVIIIGVMPNGETYKACSHSNIPNILYDLEKYKLELLRMSDV